MHSDSKAKKPSKLTKSLKLNKETLRQLTEASGLEKVVGGAAPATPTCGTWNGCTLFNCTIAC
jgi:hypothetical protein